ncbi:Protein of unknown function [Gryllus bimaculatus]|nr:Protein of unknown function [Gryllus bimaculatus]
MGSARDCLRCAGDACVKCARLIVLGSRTCVDACPSGYREEWSALVDYMGRVCRVDTPERREFLKHLSMLRCEAPVFLAMLNDTRRQTCIERFSTLPRLS